MANPDLRDWLARVDAAGMLQQVSGADCAEEIGGIVDIYPAGEAQPVRIEYIGDTIESIRSYDPATQRSTAERDQASIAPLQELVGMTDTPDRSATAFDHLWAHGRPIVIVSEPDEVRSRRSKGTSALRFSNRRSATDVSILCPADTTPGR